MLELHRLEAGSQGLQVSARRHYRLVQEDPLAPLLVRRRLQRGQEMLCLRRPEEEIAWKKT